MARVFDDASSQTLYGALSQAEPFTLACWGYLHDLNNHALFSIGQSAGTYYHALLWFSSALQAYTTGSEGGSGASATSSPSANTWFHTCGVFTSSSSRTIYLDGGNSATNSNTRTVSSPNQIRIGVTADSTPFAYMDGAIAEAAVWAAALTAAEAAVLATGVSPLMVRPQSLVFYCPLIRDNDEDIVGGLSLTAGGTPTVGVHPRIIYPMPSAHIIAAAAAVGRTTKNIDAFAHGFKKGISTRVVT